MPLTKLCPICQTTKLVEEFAKNAGKKDGLQYRCKACMAIYRNENRAAVLENKRQHYKENRERLLQEKKEKYIVDAEKKKQYQRAYSKNNMQSIRERLKDFYARRPDYYKELRKKYPDRINAKENKRKTAKLKRMPIWLTVDDHWMIKEAYALAALRTQMFGFSWHVDHVLPLQGKLVSGLHVPLNLQVIPGAQNTAKGNRFEV
jgi:rubredoxin